MLLHYYLAMKLKVLRVNDSNERQVLDLNSNLFVLFKGFNVIGLFVAMV